MLKDMPLSKLREIYFQALEKIMSNEIDENQFLFETTVIVGDTKGPTYYKLKEYINGPDTTISLMIDTRKHQFRPNNKLKVIGYFKLNHHEKSNTIFLNINSVQAELIENDNEPITPSLLESIKTLPHKPVLFPTKSDVINLTLILPMDLQPGRIKAYNIATFWIS